MMAESAPLSLSRAPPLDPRVFSPRVKTRFLLASFRAETPVSHKSAIPPPTCEASVEKSSEKRGGAHTCNRILKRRL